MIHEVLIKSFAMNEDLSLLKEEIETYNPELKLLKNQFGCLFKIKDKLINMHLYLSQ